MRRTYAQRIGYATIGIALLLVFNAIGLLRPVVNIARTAVVPIQRFFHERGVSGSEPEEYADTSRDGLIAQILQLQTRINSLEQEKIKQRVLAEEYTALADSLSFKSRVHSRTVQMATVVGFGSGSDASLILIDKGTQEGLQVGQAVGTPEGVYIGTVYRAFEQAAYVRLITHPHAAVAVANEQTGELTGMVQGSFGLSAELTMVPKNTGVKTGDLLYTAGIDKHIPPGMLVGSVETIEPELNTQFLRGIVRLRFSPQSTRLVTVITDSLPDTSSVYAP